MFNRFIYRREWSFRIYRETLSRFSCAASSAYKLIHFKLGRPNRIRNSIRGASRRSEREAWLVPHA
ncbi:hypothetical protein ABLN67_14790 [Mycobacterium tuberculosis]